MDKEKNEGFEFLDDFNDDVWDEERWEWFLRDMEEDEEIYSQDIEDGYNGERESGDGRNNNEDENYFDETELTMHWKNESWEPEKKLHGFEKIDAYVISYQFGLVIDSYVRKYYKKVDIPEVKIVLNNCFVAAKKIAIGHKIGYDKETIKGNIVSCKQGLKSIENCIVALKKMQIKSIRIRKVGLDLLIKLASKVKDAIRDWIEDLQDRIWW